MKSGRSLDLLVEITKLLRKYGPDDFRAVAELLRDPALAEEIAGALRAIVDQGSVKPKNPRSGQSLGLANRIRRLAEAEPEKAAQLRAIWEGLSVAGGMPTPAIRDYAHRAGLPPLPAGGRKQVVTALVDSLLDKDLSTVQAHAQALVSPKHSPRHLDNWSRLILDPTLRTKPGD